jgi:hypothetical protein
VITLKLKYIAFILPEKSSDYNSARCSVSDKNYALRPVGRPYIEGATEWGAEKTVRELKGEGNICTLKNLAMCTLHQM